MTRVGFRLCGGIAGLAMVIGWSTIPAELGIGSATSTSRTSSVTSTAIPPSSVRAEVVETPCEVAAEGSAGVPTARSQPLVTVRFYSTWAQILAPVVVLYRDGTVALAPEYRRGGSEPLLPYTGGRFSACALAQLERQFDAFERADVGSAQVYDATEALIEKFDSRGARTWVKQVNGFGIDDGTQGLPADQQRARRQISAWFMALTQLRNGVPLGLGRIGVAGNDGLNSGLGEDLAPVVWPTTAELTEPCTILTGAAAVDARSAVRRSAAKPEQARGSGVSYSAWFRFPTRKTKLDVMVFPPAVACLPLDVR